jgi:hypothetical protein
VYFLYCSFFSSSVFTSQRLFQMLEKYIVDDEPEPCVKKENISPVKSYGLKEFLPMSLEAQFVHETMDLVRL